MSDRNQQTMRAYLEAVAAWNLGDAAAGDLIGVAAQAVCEWRDGASAEPSEDTLARMTMVAQIRTALDIYCSSPLSEKWMSLPNKGVPYCGLSPVEYIEKHGWPGLYWVLRQAQAWAVGNH